MKRLTQCAMLALAFAAPFAVGAQDYPSKQVTMVVAYPPGGAVDAVGRLLAQKLGDAIGKPFVVDNKSGASGSIGAQFVAKAPADGHTLLVAPLTSYAMNSLLFPANTGFQLDKDFAGVSLVGFLPLVLVVNDGVPAKNVADVVKIAKDKPASLNYGSSGNGSIEHVAGEMFKHQARVSMLHIPYRGAAPAMTDVMAGQLQLMFATAPTAVANIKTGKVRPLMVATRQRIGALPDVPTAAEAGFAGFEVASTYAILAPAGTPPAILAKLNAEIGKVLQLPDVKARFQTLGIEITGSTPQEATSQSSAELAKWGKVIRDSGIKAE
ncbi:MAG: transporter [Ramlibacter sp.]|nr:transporter [Ramlibacter sp.]